MSRLSLAVASAALALAGCVSPLPRYPPMSPAESLDILARRAESVRTLAAECDVTLTDDTGKSVRLDGAIAASFPDRLRLRAWKFGRAVFDITVTDGRTWVLSDSSDSVRSPGAGLAAADRLPGAIGLLGPAYFRAATPSEAADGSLTVTGSAFDSVEAVCQIDRATLTMEQVTFSGGSAAPARRVRFERYRLIDGVPWPTGIEFAGPEGVIGLRLRDVRLNEPLAAAAFVPPRRAVEQP